MNFRGKAVKVVPKNAIKRSAKRSKVQVDWKALAALVVVLIFFGTIGYFTKVWLWDNPRQNYSAGKLPHTGYERRWNQPAPAVDVAQALPPKVRRELYEGKGIDIPFTVIYPGKLKVTKYFSVPDMKTYGEKIPKAREMEVRKLIDSEFSKVLADFATNRPIYRRVAVIVDITSKIGSSERRQIKQVFSDIDAARFLKAGKLEVGGYLISGSSYLQSKTVRNQSSASDYNEVRDWLTDDRSDERESSVALGLSNILGEIHKDPPEDGGLVILPWEIHIVSDGVENAARTLRFSKEASLLDSEKGRKELSKKLTDKIAEQQPFPKSLPEGTVVHWHLPKVEETQGLNVLDVGKFWQSLLGSIPGVDFQLHH